MKKDSLGDRMKEYENISKTKLMSRTPVILRLDGKSFHTFTKGMKRPFDDILIKTMQETMKYLCENIQGCILGYTQSDEITLVLQDWAKLNTNAWFDYEAQKMCSVGASMCTLAFNEKYSEIVDDIFETTMALHSDEARLYFSKENKAMFDCRCFNLPFEEVANNLIWRQQDATRNSILSLAQSLYTHKEIQGIKCNKLQDKMLTEKDVNWNDLSIVKKRGTCCIKKYGKWILDIEIPIFTQDREYVENLLKVEERE